MISKRLFPILELDENKKSRLSERNKTIDELLDQARVYEAEALRKDSIRRLTLMHGPWTCNFSCPDYCYTKGERQEVLSTEETKNIISQAQAMGAQVTYWPGEGEITLLTSFWDLMEHQTEKELPSVIFTNGSVFESDELATKTLGERAREVVRRVAQEHTGMHLYVKYWHSDPHIAARMTGADTYPYVRHQGHSIPQALANLMEEVSLERLGVEVMVSQENYEDVRSNILPAIEDLGLHGYIEPVIFSGNACGKKNDLALDKAQHDTLAELYASGGNYCGKRQSVELIVKGDRLTPGIAIPPRPQDTIRKHKKITDIFTVFHNDYFRNMRKQSEALGGCLCRAYWEEQA